MPDLSEHRSALTAKLLAVGDSGTGKTGSLVSLALAGYKLRILDTDKGIDILRPFLLGKVAPGQVQFVTVSDSSRLVGGKLIRDGKGFSDAMKALDKWPDGSKLSDWGPDTVFVIDSWSTLGELSMSNTQRINGSLGERPTLPQWGSAIDDMKAVLNGVMSEAVRCNVIIITHITYVTKEAEEGLKRDTQGAAESHPYPNALGSKFPTEMGKYFNTILGYKIQGSGPATRRTITTEPIGQLGIKTSIPLSAKKSYPIETGLADFFKDLGLTPPGNSNA